MPATIRISAATHQRLTEMAAQTNSTLQEMLDGAVEMQRRRLLLDGANRAYAELRQNEQSWRAWKRELRSLDTTLADGL